ncbi:hypothetical protein BDV35DRAFT_363545 [Aspergillus flavus]|uniref:Uncharacterized protein n=1 Tax=Aspergillus flavus TaxID=5059 RepID=A0A5N6GSD0_ASPFL|nr:hypothetical protein BDV35DRAFT_363545 [Aspergillus flavus]
MLNSCPQASPIYTPYTYMTIFLFSHAVCICRVYELISNHPWHFVSMSLTPSVLSSLGLTAIYRSSRAPCAFLQPVLKFPSAPRLHVAYPLCRCPRQDCKMPAASAGPMQIINGRTPGCRRKQ